MARTHNLGMPRIGSKRELKFALEGYWKGNTSRDALEEVAQTIRLQNWQAQQQLDSVPVGDFSFYDQVLDTSFMLGHIPERAIAQPASALDAYFRVARGRAPTDKGKAGVQAGEMTKWFDTNYHYIVPEFTSDTRFVLSTGRIQAQLTEAQKVGVTAKPVLVGPVTYLWLGKAKDSSERLTLLDRLLPVYVQLLAQLHRDGVDWVQLDEPILTMELDALWQAAIRKSYEQLAKAGPRVLLATYFGRLQENTELALSLPVHGLHMDAIRGRDDVGNVVEGLAQDQVLSLGVIDGRNVWRTDLDSALTFLEPIHAQLGNRLWLAPSCSLLHVPVDLESETKLDPEVRSWLAFAMQKLEELRVLGIALNEGRGAVAQALAANRLCIASRKNSKRVHRPEVTAALAQVDASLTQRKSPYTQRIRQQQAHLALPTFPTTTIGSFPQTQEIRSARRQFRNGKLDAQTYQTLMRAEIARAVKEQEDLDLDLLVHGEAERNDMVEYFGEQLEGYVFSEFGWVQSYGSRCVKPPILFGDIVRPKPMTVDWITYAQSLTSKPMKGMLTGPVTILNWSFVRDDQPREVTCKQLALAIRQEVLDLEATGVKVIQIDEAALREGLPLRREEWADYLRWAVDSFRISAAGVKDETQIHTHMCYSEFNDIIESIAEMDADVITIETSRSDMELLEAFESFQYPNEIGPGVYDIHSPNIPSQTHIVELMQKAAKRVPAERLWVNPDCGLKTRGWAEVRPALTHMVAAAKTLRAQR